MPATRLGTKKAVKITKSSRKKVRFVKAPKSVATRKRRTVQNGSTRRAPQRNSVQKSKMKTTVSRTDVSFTPGWKDLKTRRNSRHESVSGYDSGLGALSTVRFALAVLAIAGVITLYVGHVHATQNLLAEVQDLRRENLSVHLRYNRIKGMYDRSTGPSVIYERARLLDLEERMVTGKPILVSR